MKHKSFLKAINPLGLAGALCLCGLAGRAAATTFTVLNTNDSGADSLRQAIIDANATPGDDIIEFQIGANGIETIPILSALPTITETIFIDGWSQGGMGYTGPPLIEIDGSATDNITGLLISGATCANSVVRGLSIGNFPSTSISYGIGVSGAPEVWIYGCHIGVDATGNIVRPIERVGILASGAGTTGLLIGTNADGADDDFERNIISGCELSGILVQSDADPTIAGNYIGTDIAGSLSLGGQSRGVQINLSPTCTIGGPLAAQRNVISGNTESGISIFSSPGGGIRIQNNYIGLRASGTATVPNVTNGVYLSQSSGVVVGTDGNGINDGNEGNVISGNGLGIRLVTNSAAEIKGNKIGTNAAGSATLAGQQRGISIDNSTTTRIGGPLAAERNIICGSTFYGISLQNCAATDLEIQNNYIGVLDDGITAAGNTSGGIVLFTTTGVTIGTDADGTNDAAEGNVISSNNAGGVLVETNSSATIAGNYLGTTATGLVGLGAQNYGVRVSSAPTTQIGGSLAAQRNIISGNSSYGIFFSNVAGTDLVAAGNYIGVGADGTTHVANATGGILLNTATGVLIGTDADGSNDAQERNVISGNGSSGIYVFNNSQATIAGNYIGSTATGLAAIGSQNAGVRIQTSPVCQVGGPLTAQRNIISGNSNTGVYVLSTAGTDINVQNNYIGVGPDGTTAVSNVVHGVQLNAASGVLIGTDGNGSGDAEERNVISANGTRGVYLHSGSSATIAGNFIGTDASGLTGLLNQTYGVLLDNSPVCQIGGSLPAHRNVLSGNSLDAIHFVNTVGIDLVVAGNYIGVGADGITHVANSSCGVVLNNSTGVCVGTNADGSNDVQERNVVSGNVFAGVYLLNNSDADVMGNYIGTSSTGMSGIGSQNVGVRIENSPTSAVGGPLAAQRNIISGNSNTGVFVVSSTGTDIKIQNNLVGLGADGATVVTNVAAGVQLNAATGVVVGTDGDGSSDAAESNVISGNGTYGVYVRNGASAEVGGNYIGTDSTGMNAVPGQSVGVRIDNSPVNHVGGVLAEQRNIISGNLAYGVWVTNTTATDVDFLNNYIGTGVDGLTPVSNENVGVVLEASSGVVLGGSGTNEGNLIAGNDEYGMYLISAGTENNVIQGNLIGVGADGTTPLGHTIDGIAIDSSPANNTIGGILPGEGNVIANNGRAGVFATDDAGNGNLIVGNSIYDNSQLGIELHEYGPSANDPMDADGGPNAGQNFPVITRVYPSETFVEGYIESTPNSAINIHLYKSPSKNATGRGEGKTYLDTTVANTDSNGFAPFSLGIAPAVAGEFYTATATDSANNTSEFSRAFEVKDPATVASVNALTPFPSNNNVFEYEVTFSDKVTGVDVTDFAVNVVSGSVAGASVTDVLNPFENCLSLDGVGQYGDMPDGVYFSGDFTIEAWVYPRQSENYPRIAEFGNGPASDNVYLLSGNGINGTPSVGYNLGAPTEGRATASDPIPVDQWSHIAGVLEGTTLTLYVNGVAVAQDTVTNPPNAVNRSMNLIGASNWGPIQDPDANMLIDELRVWNVARSATEIQASMDVETLLTLPQAGLELYYDFDSIQDLGVGGDSLVDDLEDISGQGRHADMISPALPTLVKTDIPRDHYVVQVNTGTGDGSLNLAFLDDDSVKDMTPNPVGGNGNQDLTGPAIDIDKTVPVSLASGETTQAGDIVEIASTSTDAGSGVATVDLYVKTPVGLGFNNTGLTPDGSGNFLYTATMDGPHEFATVATDAAGNTEPVPGAGQLITLVNVVPNSDYDSFVSSPSTYLFPMTDDIDIELDFTNVTGSGLVTVSRTIPQNSAPAGYDDARLIDESLNITSAAGITDLTANLTWNFDATSDDTMTGVIENVYQFEAGTLVNTYPVSPSGNSLFIPAITSFSEWFAGNDVTAVGDWQVLDVE